MSPADSLSGLSPIPVTRLDQAASGLADLFGVTRVIFGMGLLLVASGAISALAGRRSPLVPPPNLLAKS